MAWIYLIIAGLLEIGWAFLLKRTDGFTRPGPTAATLILYMASIWLLSLALKTLSLPARATPSGWAGIGAKYAGARTPRAPLRSRYGMRAASTSR